MPKTIGNRSIVELHSWFSEHIFGFENQWIKQLALSNAYRKTAWNHNNLRATKKERFWTLIKYTWIFICIQLLSTIFLTK